MLSTKPLLACCLVTVSLTFSASAQIIVENSAFANSGSGSANPTVNTTFSVGASSKYLVVAIAGEFDATTAVTSVTLDATNTNQNLAELGVASSGSSGSQQKVFMFGIANPTTGSNLDLDIVPANFGVANGGYDYAVWSLENVDTSITPNFIAAGNGSATTISQTLSLTSGQFIVAGSTFNNDANITGSLTSLPGGSSASFASIGTGIATGNQAARLGAGSFTADVDGDYGLQFAGGGSRTALASVSFAVVPEPTSLALLMMGGCAVGLIAFPRRRRNANR